MKQQSEIKQNHNSEKEEEKRSQKRPWLWKAGPKQGLGLGGGRGLCLGPTGLEKALGVWVVGLRLNRTEGAQACLPPLVSESGRPHLRAQ